MYESLSIIVARFFSESHCYFYERICRFYKKRRGRSTRPFPAGRPGEKSLTNPSKRVTLFSFRKTIWAYSSVGSASVSLLCPTELWAFKWGVCRLVAQPRHAPKYGPIAQLGERSVRIREVKGSNPSRSTNLPHRFVRCGVFYAQKTLADRAGLRTLKSDANRAGSSMYFLKIHRFHVSFFAFCRVLRASASLLCPLLGDFFKNFRTIVD